MSDIPTDANFWIKIWTPIGVVLMASLSLFGMASARIGKVEADHKDLKDKGDCREDRDDLREYVQEIKKDIHGRLDRMERNVLKAIKGE